MPDWFLRLCGCDVVNCVRHLQPNTQHPSRFFVAAMWSIALNTYNPTPNTQHNFLPQIISAMAGRVMNTKFKIQNLK